MRHLVALAALSACSSLAEQSVYQGSLDSIGLAVATSPSPVGAPLKDDAHGLGRGLVELTVAMLDAGYFDGDGSVGPAPDIAYTEFKMLAGRERSDDLHTEAFGLGAELSIAIAPATYTRIGFWVLEEENKDKIINSEIGRLSLGVGHAVRFTESTHLTGSVGFQWERDRWSSVNFFSFAHDSNDGIFGSTESEFGFDADLALRQRLTSWLELDAGVRIETLREGSTGAFGNVRIFLGRNAALFVEYEDVDEPTFTAGLSLLGSR